MKYLGWIGGNKIFIKNSFATFQQGLSLLCNSSLSRWLFQSQYYFSYVTQYHKKCHKLSEHFLDTALQIKTLTGIFSKVLNNFYGRYIILLSKISFFNIGPTKSVCLPKNGVERSGSVGQFFFFWGVVLDLLKARSTKFQTMLVMRGFYVVVLYVGEAHMGKIGALIAWNT